MLVLAVEKAEFQIANSQRIAGGKIKPDRMPGKTTKPVAVICLYKLCPLRKQAGDRFHLQCSEDTQYQCCQACNSH